MSIRPFVAAVVSLRKVITAEIGSLVLCYDGVSLLVNGSFGRVRRPRAYVYRAVDRTRPRGMSWYRKRAFRLLAGYAVLATSYLLAKWILLPWLLVGLGIVPPSGLTGQTLLELLSILGGFTPIFLFHALQSYRRTVSADNV